MINNSEGKIVFIKISIYCLLVIVLAALSGCREASDSPIDTDLFTYVMTEKGYEVTDATEEAKERESFFQDTLQNSVVAFSDEYYFVFFELYENSYAQMVFRNTQQNLQATRGSDVTVQSEQSTPYHDVYSFNSEGTYFHLVRVHNIVIFTHADVEHRNSIKQVLSNFQIKEGDENSFNY